MSNATLTVADVTYERHPYSAVFPLMSAEDYALLLESIRDSGQRVPIKLLGENLVFDGWNRLRACAELGKAPTFEQVSEDQDLQALTIALNLAHRHLTAGQKGLIAGQLATMAHGGGRPGAGRRDSEGVLEASGSLNNQDLKLDLEFADAEQAPGTSSTSTHSQVVGGTSIKASAIKFGISRATAAKGKRIATNGETVLVDAIKAGDISLGDGYKIALLSPEEQRESVRIALESNTTPQGMAKSPRALADKCCKLALKGKELPDDLTTDQLTPVFVRITEEIVVGTYSRANCIEKYIDRFDPSAIAQFKAAHQRMGEALDRYPGSPAPTDAG
ncbi:MAG: hypothetical protein ABL985_06100 [Casimicrobium sp.]